MTQQPSRPYIGYEYKEIPATGKDASLLLDCYESFGWVPDENRAPAPGRQPSVVYLKRDRKIVNKMELTRLREVLLQITDPTVDVLVQTLTEGLDRMIAKMYK